MGHSRGLRGTKCVRGKSALQVEAGASSQHEYPKDSVVFAGVKFGHPISSSLEYLGIQEPSPIQDEAILALSTGLSCIIHAETGSGKTLCYLLPLMKRLLANKGSTEEGNLGVQALIVVPSKELAIQVAADVATLVSNTGANSIIDTSLVHLCIESGRAGLDSIEAPVVIGTPYKLMDAVRSSSTRTLTNLNFLVLDEVDRMLQVSSKYASNEARRKANSVQNPVKDLVADLVRIRGFIPPDKNGILPPEATSTMQVVAASATIGRPLRRELYHVLLGGGERSPRSSGELPLIRAETPMRKEISHSAETDDNDDTISSEQLSAEDILEHDEYSMDGDEETPAGANRMRGKTNSRKIGIPPTIRHVALLLTDQTDSLTSKISTIKQLWTVRPMKGASRAMLFVPNADDVKQVTGMLSFMGLSDEVKDLQGQLGIKEPARDKSNQKRTPTYSQKKKNSQIDEMPRSKTSTRELVERAAQSKLGAWSAEDKNIGSSDDSDNESRQLYVIPLSGTRGLHIKDIEYVIITAPPRTMDEYLHVAGRTGRAGNTVPGTVVTLATYEELKRLQSWETPLGITFDIQYE